MIIHLIIYTVPKLKLAYVFWSVLEVVVMGGSYCFPNWLRTVDDVRNYFKSLDSLVGVQIPVLQEVDI